MPFESVRLLPRAGHLKKEFPLRMNYVLIDFENVQPDQLILLKQDHFKVMIFVGANQGKLSYEIAAAIQHLGTNAEYVKISGNGRNALDFHIAFYIGQIASIDSNAYFHVISRDSGFDPLIQHLRVRKIFAARARDISEIPLIKLANSKSPQERAEFVVAKLQQLKGSKPRTANTLASTIASLFRKQLSDAEVTAILNALKSKGLLTIIDKKVSYVLPTDG